ncbi:Gp49 family protein [Hyphomicrobium sp. ghe19]|uniref:Gp49 family protein n=1 Tax=Hyphomicrobium sp. ghe19 TaxID=2682968 RepID=UPI0013670F33|nr:hypothetical protein HYPP_02603 [Hyphomicrobium sp. ghe19]
MREPGLTTEAAKQVVAEKCVFPKVTENSIKDHIKAARYLADGSTTICILEMYNGFKVIGHSTPADIRNFNEEVGRRFAFDNAFRQLWQLEGYLLRDKLWSNQGQSYQGGL